MGDQAKNILIGGFVLAAFLIVTFMLLFLNPTVGDDSKKYKVRFSDIDKVNVGTRVTYGGRPVGEVTEIKMVQDPRNPREVENGHIYLYELTLGVDSSVNVFNSDTITLRTSGLLGERSVAITPMPPKPGEPLTPVEQNQVIFALETGSVEETLKDFKQLSDKFEDTLNAIQKTFQDINNEKIVAKMGETIEGIGAIANVIMEDDRLRNTLDNLHQFSDDLAQGNGTVGQLIKNDEMYLRLNALIGKAEIILDDINHYGPFYASDKNWQRLRARRANLLYCLSTPQQFKNYFNDEVDEIFTSLDRVNQVLQETEGMDPCGLDPCGLNKGDFKKVFAELMRRVKQMEESLRLYNIQLNAPLTNITEICE